MSRFYLLEPSVYGELGEDAVLDPSAHPPIVRRAHLVLFALPQTDLHTSYPCYFVSRRLADALTEARVSGVEFGECQVELDEQYRELCPGEVVPEVLWLNPSGRACDSDVAVDAKGDLVVSDAAMQVLHRFRLDDCQVYDAENPPTPEQITEDMWADARAAAEALRRARWGEMGLGESSSGNQ